MLRVGLFVLKGIYVPIKLRKTENRITIISRQDRRESIDIRLLREAINSCYPDIDCRVLVKFIEPRIGSKIAYAFHMITQMKAIASSKVVVLDGYCIVASVLNHKPETRLLQMWHSMAAIKQFGWQTVGLPGGSSEEISEIMCMHRNYDWVLAPSQETGRYFCRGFKCHKSCLRIMALPRLDYIRDTESREASQLNEMCSKIRGKREILLYAPTFRKKGTIGTEKLFKCIDFSRFLLVVRPHPLDTDNHNSLVDRLSLDKNVIIDSKGSSFDWLKVCDRIITDYSALAVEALVTGKPVYFYVFDIDEYLEKVGLNVNPLAEMPEISAKSPEKLKILIDEDYDYDALAEIRRRYLTAETEDCSLRLAEFICSKVEES